MTIDDDNRICLGSAPWIHTPGMLKYWRDPYASHRKSDRSQAVREFTAVFPDFASVIPQLLNRATPFTVREDKSVVFDIPTPTQLTEETSSANARRRPATTDTSGRRSIARYE